MVLRFHVLFVVLAPAYAGQCVAQSGVQSSRCVGEGRDADQAGCCNGFESSCSFSVCDAGDSDEQRSLERCGLSTCDGSNDDGNNGNEDVDGIMGIIVPILIVVGLVHAIIQGCRKPKHPLHKFLGPIGEKIVENSCIGPILDSMGGQSKLHKAAYLGDVASVTRLLETGADLNALNKAGASPLHSAFFFNNGLDDWQSNLSTDEKFRRATGKFDVAKLLLAKGASKTLVDSFKKTPVRHQLAPRSAHHPSGTRRPVPAAPTVPCLPCSPMRWVELARSRSQLEAAPDAFACARAGLLEGMKYMIELHEIDPMAERPNAPVTGETLLHAATFCGAKWAEGKKLCTSAINGKAQTVQYLLGLGLSADAPNGNGHTPRFYATIDETNPYAKHPTHGPKRALYQAINNVLPAPGVAAATGAVPMVVAASAVPVQPVVVEAVPMAVP